MALTTRLEFRQSQALVMTPQLMQAIKLLQLSNLDLHGLCRGGTREKPAARAHRDDDGPGACLPKPPNRRARLRRRGSLTNGWARISLPAAMRSRTNSAPGSTTFFRRMAARRSPRRATEDATAAHSEWASVGSGGREDGEYNLEAFVSAERTLADHLSEQLSLSVTDPVTAHDRPAPDRYGRRGRLSDQAISRRVAEKLGADMADVEAVLAILQCFDPAGVCARNLTECLAIQLKEQNRYDPAMAALLGRLDLLAKRDFASLRKFAASATKTLSTWSQRSSGSIQSRGLRLDRRPCSRSCRTCSCVPHRMAHSPVELNSETLPKILLNQTYHARVSKTAATPTDKAYLAEKLQSATWLIRALDQRARTILKVSAEIVKQQDAFFAHGVQHLRPLNLKTIADAISMHESTVSRVTANKYMATSRGIFELKYFFTSAIAASNGGEVAFRRSGSPSHQASDRGGDRR